ncbi:MAG: four helix bundle protein [Chitinophagales bacterium]|nr:four helix bundle protein [Chitinophagales bacterium]
MKENIIRDKSFQFAIKSIDLYKELVENKEFVLSKQFLRSATSIGANMEEATAGVSKKDFVNKIAISSKEARESFYWLRLIEYYNQDLDLRNLKSDCEELIKILTKFIKTSQENI